VSVCLFARISPEPRALSLPIFVHVAYVRGSVFLRHVHNRPHRLSPGRVFSIENALYSTAFGTHTDGSAQCGRSMLSTILFLPTGWCNWSALCVCVSLYLRTITFERNDL